MNPAVEQRLRERYVADLTRDEDALVRLSAELEQARREKQTLDAELRQRTSTLKFDATL